MNYCPHCHMIIFVLSYDQLSSSSFHMTTIKCFKHHSKFSVYAAFSTIQGHLYAKSMAFKIHSIEIEDPSHHWLPVVYLHVDTKGHLLSRWIAKNCLIFSSSFWSLWPQSHFYFHVWKQHHHFSHFNDISFL